jgi:hypothetical protein
MKSRRAVLELAATAAACFAFAERHSAMAAASDPGFRTNISTADDMLVIDYRIENTTEQPVFVTNKIWRLIEGKPKIDPDFVYGKLTGDILLTVFKTMPEIPHGKSPANLVAPYTTRLDPGQSITETVNLQIPVHTYLEYTDNSTAKDDKGEPLLVTVSEVVFAIGYFLLAPGSSMRKEKAFGTEVDLFQNPPGARATYGILSSPKVRLSIPVYKRAAG